MTGELVWHAEDDPISYSSPIEITINNIRQIVYLSADGLVSLSPEDGHTNWDKNAINKIEQTNEELKNKGVELIKALDFE